MEPHLTQQARPLTLGGQASSLSLDLPLGTDQRSPIVYHADHAGLDVAVGEEKPPHEALEGRPEVFEMVRVEQRIPRGVQVREDDAEVHEDVVDFAPSAERHHAVYGVEREPADDEEDHDPRKILRGLHLALPRRAQKTQHGPRCLVSGPTTWIHGHYLL